MTNAHRILVVDDNSHVAFSLGKALKYSSENYAVKVAHSGEEALDVLDDWPVDLLITDLCMSGFSGLELIRQIQAFIPQTHTILITGYGDGEVVAEASRLSVYRYIAKPFRLEVILNTVREALAE